MPGPRRARRRRRRPRRRRCRPRTARARCASARSTGSSARRSPPTTCRRCSTRSGTPCRGTGDVRDGRPAVVAPRQHRGDRRHRGGRPPLRLRPHRQGGARRRRMHGRLSVAQQRRRRLRDVLLGLGITEAMPNPFLAPDALTRAGLDGDALRITNPLVADESVLRTSLRPGPAAGRRLQRVAPPARRRAVRDRPRLPARTGRAARRVRGARRRARRPRRRRPRSPCGARSPRRWASARASTRAGCRPGCTRRARRRSSPGATSIGAVGEVAPDVLEAFDIAERVAVLELDLRSRARPASPSRRRGSRPAGTRRATSTWRSRSPTTCRPRSSTRRSARAPARCSSTSSCSTSTAAPASATGAAASPTACACRRRTATSPTPTSPTCGPRSRRRRPSSGAELRG